LRVASSGAAVLSVGVFARSRETSLELNGTFVRSTGRGRVLEDGQPSDSVFGADAEVDGSIVANVRAGRSPLASLSGGVTNRVQVVLSRGRCAFPGVVI